MIASILRFCVAAFLVTLLAACSHYEYYPPASEAGRQCTVQCAAVREMCISNEYNRAQYDRASCEQRNHWNYQQCMRHANDKDDAKACARAQPACFANPNNFRCDENYRSCYINCGGKVILVEDK